MIFCRDCQDSQLEVIATRVVGKTPVCDVHLRSRMGLPKKIEPEEAKDMGKWKRTDATTIEAIRKDATAGMGLSAIAEKNGVSWPTAKRYAGNGKGRAGGAKTAKPTRRGGHTNGASNGSYSVQLSTAGMDALWNGLAPEKKAELLKGL